MMPPASRLRFGSRGRGRDEQGTAILEFSLALVILLSFLFGVIQVSVAVYGFFFVSEAARTATRYAIVRGSSCAATPAYCTAATSSSVQAFVQNLGYPGINYSNVTVTTTWPDTSGCSPSSSPCNNPGNHVMVTVLYGTSLGIPFVSANALSFSSTSEMVISN